MYRTQFCFNYGKLLGETIQQADGFAKLFRSFILTYFGKNFKIFYGL